MFNNMIFQQTSNSGELPEKFPEFDYNSFYRAIVTSIDDPEHLGRIRVKIPSLHARASESQLPYAYPACFTGLGNQVGQFILPPVGSIVFVTFEYSEEHRIIYFGGVPTKYAEGKEQYYGKRINDGEPILVTQDDLPTEYTGSQYIIYKSPSGSIIYIDDADTGPKIVIRDSIGQEIKMVSNDIDNQEAGGAIILKHNADNLIRIEDGAVIIRVKGVDYSVPWESEGSGGTSDFKLLINKPILNTNNTSSLQPEDSEEINNTINLHKVSKTGMYSDLIGLPTIPSEQVNSDWNSTSGKSQILNKPNLSKVATSGNYNDLSNKPNLAEVATTGSYLNLTNTPTLSDVATTGDYNDLSNKPYIPIKLSEFENDANFITKADVPTNLSKFNNDTGFITSDALPTKVSELTNDAGFITNESLPTKLSELNNDTGFITNSDLPTKLSELDNDTNYITSEDLPKNVSELNNDARYITSDALPTKVSELENDSKFITSADIPEQVNADWNATSGKAQILNKPTIPSISGLEKESNKVAISASSTEQQYPNAKSVYDFVKDSVSSIPQGLKIPVSIANESELPTTASNGDYYVIQNMNVTAPDHTGRAWYNDQWYKVIDQYQSMDGVSIVQSGGGSWQVSTEWLHGVLNLSNVATTGSYNDLTDKPTLSRVATTGSYTDLSGTPTLSKVATSNNYNDLSNKPSLSKVATSGKYSDLTGTPTLSTVATSGSYNDLSNKPTIPSEQVNSDWNSTSGKSQILNKPTLSTVATSGKYSDLSGTPTLATVATSGKYSDLSGLPTIPSDSNLVHLSGNETVSGKKIFKNLSTDNSNSRTKFNIACGTMGNVTTYRYYPLFKLPTISSVSNYASVILSGRIGGYVDKSQHIINVLIDNRGATGFYGTDIGYNKDYDNYIDIQAYQQEDNTVIVYLRCKSYYIYDLTVTLTQSVIVWLYDETYLDAPVGTLVKSLSTAKHVLRYNVGNLYINDKTLAAISDIPTKVSQLTNDSNYITSASLPTKTSQLTNDSGFITSSAVPTKVSELTNDSKFITSSASITGNASTATRATYASGSSTTGKLRNITISTSQPSGGSDGDIWIVYS